MAKACENSCELPLRAPFQDTRERGWVLAALLLLLILPVLVSWLPLERELLLRQIVPSETDGQFLSQEIYHKDDPVDLLIVGPCLTWWQIYPPYIVEELKSRGWVNPTVLNLGFNHFGSDLIYLILKDIVKRRRIKNLLLTLPKIEDVLAFPHANAIQWWIYPRDLDEFAKSSSLSQLSWSAHLRLYGLSLFSAIQRLLLFTRPVAHTTIQRAGLGFNEGREELLAMERWDGATLSTYQSLEKQLSQSSGPNFAGNTITLAKASKNEIPSASTQVPSVAEWRIFFRAVHMIAQENDIHVSFVDSPHANDFNPKAPTTAWSLLADFAPTTPVIRFDFSLWPGHFSTEQWQHLVRGSNLTPLGARLFSKALAIPLAKALVK